MEHDWETIRSAQAKRASILFKRRDSEYGLTEYLVIRCGRSGAGIFALAIYEGTSDRLPV